MYDTRSVSISGLRWQVPAGPVVLDGVSLETRAGRLTAIKGPSGSGKTTLLNCIAGLLTPATGTITVGDTLVTALRGGELERWRAATLGLLFQQPSLLPYLTAVENVDVVLRVAGVPADERRARTQAVLEQLGVDTLGRRLPDEMSGGQRQRVALARALAPRPALLLADEPTSALDGTTSEFVWAVLADPESAGAGAVVVATHDDAVDDQAPDVFVMADGRLVGQDQGR